jgi:hypothetical protein
VLSAPNAGVSKLDAAAAVTQAITSAIVQASTSPSSEAIDLGSTQFLSAVLTTSIAETSATLSASQIGQIVQVASASNAIADKASSITDLAKAASAAQDATTALVSAAASGNFTSVVSGFTGTALEAKQAAATVGEIAPGVVVPVPPPPPPPPPVIGGGGGGIVLPPPVPTTFTVTATGADTLVFDGNATGPIQVVLASAAADGSVTATFTRGGVSTSADISGKAMLVPSDSAIFDLVGTVGSDTLRFKLTETSSELTLSGNLSEGADRIVVVVPDLEDNALDIKLIASDGDLLDGLDDELIIAFSAGDDSFSLRQGSELRGFEALQIRGGQLADVSNASFDPFPQISFVGLSDGGVGI